MTMITLLMFTLFLQHFFNNNNNTLLFTSSFAPPPTTTTITTSTSIRSSHLYSSTNTNNGSGTWMEALEQAKQDLLQTCNSSNGKPSQSLIRNKISSLEALADQVGIRQASSHSGLLNGEWYVLFVCIDSMIHSFIHSFIHSSILHSE